MRLGWVAEIRWSYRSNFGTDSFLQVDRIAYFAGGVLHHPGKIAAIGKGIVVLIRPRLAHIAAARQHPVASPRAQERRTVALAKLVDQPVPVRILHEHHPMSRTDPRWTICARLYWRGQECQR